MSVFEDEPALPSRRRPLLLLVFRAGRRGGWILVVLSRPKPARGGRRRRARRRLAGAITATGASAARETKPAPTEAAGPCASPPSPRRRRPSPRSSAGVLRVRSDVPGASVFLDASSSVPRPRRRRPRCRLAPLNVSVDGTRDTRRRSNRRHAGRVDVRFKEVRLNASVRSSQARYGLVHRPPRRRHVRAALREPLNAGAPSPCPCTDLEAFTVDYLKKSLRVKRRGGRRGIRGSERAAGSAVRLPTATSNGPRAPAGR